MVGGDALGSTEILLWLYKIYCCLSFLFVVGVVFGVYFFLKKIAVLLGV